jgi:heavy metal sensor kinase
MTLVNRVSLFFMVALAFVLVAYSVLFYTFVSRQLYEQFDRELHSLFHTLVASIEVEADGVKWQPTEHAIRMGLDEDADEVRWVVCDPNGRVVEHSQNLSQLLPQERRLLELGKSFHSTPDVTVDVDGWRIVQEELRAPHPKSAEDRNSDGDDDDDDDIKVVKREPDEFDALLITVGKSPVGLHANIHRLRWLVVCLPLAVWLLAAIVGRWFCRRALQPLSVLAKQVRGMSGHDFRQRLAASPRPDELGQLSDSFNRLLDRLQESYDQQQRFTGDAAHELRTPLTVLLGQIEVAMRRPRTTEEYQNTLETLRDETLELREIVEALLFLARSSEETSPPDLQRIDLVEWLPKYCERWETNARHEDLRLEMQSHRGNVELDSAFVSVSIPLLTQLLDNLIGNALKYSSAGKAVEVKLLVESNEAVLAVIDRGKGIDPKECETIFKPFYRTSAARSSGVAGTGLGLAISARIASALGGTLDCQSTLGVGSRFRLKLPLASQRSECLV